MRPQKIFVVNKYISLALEDDATIIYVNGKYFNQCKFLLLNIPVDNITDFDDIESIDEAATRLDSTLETQKNKHDIPPETIFWGHCSNLQVWVENEYNTKRKSCYAQNNISKHYQLSNSIQVKTDRTE